MDGTTQAIIEPVRTARIRAIEVILVMRTVLQMEAPLGTTHDKGGACRNPHNHDPLDEFSDFCRMLVVRIAGVEQKEA